MTPDVTGTFAPGGFYDCGDGTGDHPWWFNAAAGYYLWATMGVWRIVNQPPHDGTTVTPAVWAKAPPGYGDAATGMLGAYNPGAGATGVLTISE